MKQQDAERFAVIVSGPDENINLAEAALLIARHEYPDLEPEHYLRRLDAMAAQCRARLSPAPSAAEAIAGLSDYLFAEAGFRGDLRTFNDPRNSFLNDVLDRRLGIPITLSLLYMEVGARLGLHVDGISFPGHFLVRAACEGGGIVLDPFGGGRPLDRAELQRRLLNLPRGAGGPDLEALLQAASRREIVARMLRNLRAIYVEQEAFARALETVNMILEIFPAAPAEIRDRAGIHERMDCVRAAIADYERYLLLAPDAGDAGRVQARLIALKGSAFRLH
jgi:regulator of sirC expression with transglutaminase-like and TPR domain